MEINVFPVDADQSLRNDTPPTSQYVVVEVKDSGKGFAPQLAESVVEPFITTHDTGRIGLGLSVARGVCFAHDGWITISSIQNNGTTARMYLPIAAED